MYSAKNFNGDFCKSSLIVFSCGLSFIKVNWFKTRSFFTSGETFDRLRLFSRSLYRISPSVLPCTTYQAGTRISVHAGQVELQTQQGAFHLHPAHHSCADTRAIPLPFWVYRQVLYLPGNLLQYNTLIVFLYMTIREVFKRLYIRQDFMASFVYKDRA